jgi:hypothetical protein
MIKKKNLKTGETQVTARHLMPEGASDRCQPRRKPASLRQQQFQSPIKAAIAASLLPPSAMTQ